MSIIYNYFLNFILILCLTNFFIFGQTTDGLLKEKTKQTGFFVSPKSLFFNTPETFQISEPLIIKEIDKSLERNKNKFKLRERKENYFAYSDGKSVFLNSNNYKNNLDYFIKTYRWRQFYVFEDQFVDFFPSGFINFGFGGVLGSNLGFGTSFVVQDIYCVFNTNEEDFLCLDKSIVRNRIRNYDKELIRKFRKTNKKIEDLINIFEEIHQKDSLAIYKILKQ